MFINRISNETNDWKRYSKIVISKFQTTRKILTKQLATHPVSKRVLPCATSLPLPSIHLAVPQLRGPVCGTAAVRRTRARRRSARASPPWWRCWWRRPRAGCGPAARPTCPGWPSGPLSSPLLPRSAIMFFDLNVKMIKHHTQYRQKSDCNFFFCTKLYNTVITKRIIFTLITLLFLLFYVVFLSK